MTQRIGATVPIVAKPTPRQTGERARLPYERCLSPRLYQCLVLTANGLSNAEIGAQLGITRLTSRTYMSKVLTVLGARNYQHAVALAMGRGILTNGDIEGL